MANEPVNEAFDFVEVRFSWIEQQVTDINHIVILLMDALRNNMGLFGEDGGLNAKEKSEGGSRDWEDTKK